MRLFSFLLLFISTPKALTAADAADGGIAILEPTDVDNISYCDDEFLHENDYGKPASSPGVDCPELDAVFTQDGANETELSGLPFPGLVKIGYGGLWKKGIQHWVAFPMLGLVACKQFVDIGRMSVGPKHGACQKSFKVANKWYQLYGCNPTTGMPTYLLNGEGVTIASCAAKQFQVLCVKEGKIWGRGSCEGPPPDEPEALHEREQDTDGRV